MSPFRPALPAWSGCRASRTGNWRPAATPSPFRAPPDEVRRAGMNHERAPHQAAAEADRAAGLVAKMSLADKIALACHDFAAVAHLGLPALRFTDGGNGIRGANGATGFPACVSLAGSFDEQLAYQFGSAVGQEARCPGHNVLLGPALDIARTPLAGRQAEADRKSV